MFVILIPYITVKFMTLVDKSDPKSTFNEVYHNITDLGALPRNTIQYDFAFAFLNEIGQDMFDKVDET